MKEMFLPRGWCMRRDGRKRSYHKGAAIAVSRKPDGWALVVDGREFAKYDTAMDAIRFAEGMTGARQRFKRVRQAGS